MFRQLWFESPFRHAVDCIQCTIVTIPFPCHFRQNEIELCQDENQDRVNEFQFRFREKTFRQYGTELLRRK